MKEKHKGFLVFLLISLILSYVVYNMFFLRKNVIIHIANESNEIEFVDFTLKIDDIEVARDTMTDDPIWIVGKSFSDKLTPGKHYLTVISKKHNYTRKTAFWVYYKHLLRINLIGPDTEGGSHKVNELFYIEKKLGKKIVVE